MAYKAEVYFVQFWKLRNPRSRYHDGRLHSVEYSQFAGSFYLLYSHYLFVCTERVREFSGVSSYKDTNPMISEFDL